MNKLAIIGAGGHGKVVADLALTLGWRSVSFFDDRLSAGFLVAGRWRVEGTVDSFLHSFNGYDGIVVAIGDNKTRAMISDRLESVGCVLSALVHPSATLSVYTEIGEGTVVFAGAVINVDASIGRGVIINTAATIDHDCILGDYTHVSPGANLAGNVRVMDKAWIGIGCSIVQSVTIGKEAVVGAGAVVISDIPPGSKAVGVPARVIS